MDTPNTYTLDNPVTRERAVLVVDTVCAYYKRTPASYTAPYPNGDLVEEVGLLARLLADEVGLSDHDCAPHRHLARRPAPRLPPGRGGHRRRRLDGHHRPRRPYTASGAPRRGRAGDRSRCGTQSATAAHACWPRSTGVTPSCVPISGRPVVRPRPRRPPSPCADNFWPHRQQASPGTTSHPLTESIRRVAATRVPPVTWSRPRMCPQPLWRGCARDLSTDDGPTARPRWAAPARMQKETPMALMVTTIARPRSRPGAMCAGRPFRVPGRQSSHRQYTGHRRYTVHRSHIQPTIVALATVRALAAREETIHDGA